MTFFNDSILHYDQGQKSTLLEIPFPDGHIMDYGPQCYVQTAHVRAIMQQLETVVSVWRHSARRGSAA